MCDENNYRAYDELADVYDLIQAEIDPAAWAAAIDGFYKKYSRPHEHQGQEGRPLLLDLGCGTGRMTEAFLAIGYDTIGIDASPMMLEHASDRIYEAMDRAASGCGTEVVIDGAVATDPATEAANDGEAATAPETADGDDLADLPASIPLFLLQDITDFELYGTVDLMVCLLDTVNHILDETALRRFFALCANYLNPGGVLVFDIVTPHHLQRVLGDRDFFIVKDDYTLFWVNRFDDEAGLSTSALTLFDKEEDGRYSRRDCEISERVYPVERLISMLEEAGFVDIHCFGDLDERPLQTEDSRGFVVACSGKAI